MALKRLRKIFNENLTFIFLLGWGNAFAQHALILQPDPECGKDALLHGLISEKLVNYGNNAQFMSNAWTYGGTPGVVRSVVEFNLSSIPSGALIDSAYLSLYAWGLPTGSGPHSSLTGSNVAWLRRVVSPWSENTVTWNTQPSSTLINQVSVPASAAPSEDYRISVTSLVQDMIINPSGSFGFMILLQTESYYRRLNFCSSDHSDSLKRPKLEVYYTSTVSPDNSVPCGVPFVPLEAILVMPDVFTPDHSGQNDFFSPVKMYGIRSMHTQIYNRWGNIVYDTEEIPVKWDGSANGEPASTGTYYWLITYMDEGNNISSLHGFLQLIR